MLALAVASSAAVGAGFPRRHYRPRRSTRRAPACRASPSPPPTSPPTSPRRTTTNGEGDYSDPLPQSRAPTRSPRSSPGSRKSCATGIEVQHRRQARRRPDASKSAAWRRRCSVTAESPLLDDDAAASAGQVIGEKRDLDDAAVGRQPVRAGAAGAGHRLQRRPEVLAAVRQRRHLGHHRRRRDRAATSSRSTDRRTWPTAAASRSCRRPARCRSSRSRPRASTPAAATRPARRSTSRSRAAPTASRRSGYTYYRSRQAGVDRLLRQEDRRREAGPGLQAPGRSPRRAGAIPGSTTATTGRSSSPRSSGSTTRSPSRCRRRCRREAMRNGDFSALLGAGHHHLRSAHGAARSARASSGSRFAGNIIPANRINPIAQKS